MNILAKWIERSATFYKDETAIIYNNQMISFGKTHDLSNAIYSNLKKLEVEKSDRVGVFLPNSLEFVLVDFSLIKGGYVRVPINTRLVPDEIEHICNDAGVTVLFYHKEYEEKVMKMKENLSTIKHYICVGSHGETEDINFDSLLEVDVVEIYENTEPSDPYQILYTSGTTGKPKGVLTTVLSRISSLNNVFIDEVPIEKGDVMLHVASLAHGGGTKVLPHFVKGAVNILMDKFTEEDFFEMVEKYGVTTTWMVPTMVSMLNEHPANKEYDLTSLKTVIYAGAPMPVAVIRKAIETFGNIFIQVYGLSEAPNPDLVLSKCDHLEGYYEKPHILRSAGRVILNGDMKLIDTVGNEVEPNVIGEILLKGDNIMSGYWNLPEVTVETIQDGWLYTGDLAYKDEEGYVYIVDRNKDMIISGGYNIYPREIEEVLYRHPAILEATVFGVPDETWGESVKACVVIREGFKVTEKEIVNYCKEHLASYKKPTSIDFMGNLPKSSNGKILKREIRDKFWKEIGRAIN